MNAIRHSLSGIRLPSCILVSARSLSVDEALRIIGPLANVWLFDIQTSGSRSAVSPRYLEIRAKKYAEAWRETRLSKLLELGK